MISPPITTTASGRCTSDPGPVANRNGISPSIATVAVISTGRSRCVQPCTSAARCAMPSSRRLRIYDTSTTPFSTAMPHRVMKPTDAGTDRNSPVKSSAKMPPIDAKGSTRMMRPAYRAELNSTKSRKKIARIVIGTMIMSRFIARSMFSNCPPHSR